MLWHLFKKGSWVDAVVATDVNFACFLSGSCLTPAHEQSLRPLRPCCFISHRRVVTWANERLLFFEQKMWESSHCPKFVWVFFSSGKARRSCQIGPKPLLLFSFARSIWPNRFATIETFVGKATPCFVVVVAGALFCMTGQALGLDKPPITWPRQV